VTPPGVWNRKAMGWVAQHALGTAETARVFAALNVAMADALVACWQAKFEHWSVRPVNVIREKLDPDFLPWLFTPPFPSYVSGHAAVSGAAAEVLAASFRSRPTSCEPPPTRRRCRACTAASTFVATTRRGCDSAAGSVDACSSVASAVTASRQAASRASRRSVGEVAELSEHFAAARANGDDHGTCDDRASRRRVRSSPA
jgi:hypothetical protein